MIQTRANPTTGIGRTPFPNNTISTNRINPQALAFIRGWPLLNTVGPVSGYGFRNYYATSGTDKFNVQLQYPGPNEFTATFEATLMPSIKGEAIEMCGTEGRLWIDRSRYEWYPTGAKEPAEVVQGEVLPNHYDSLTQAHVNNFLQCLKTRERLNGDVLIGHRSAQASHLGNIAYEQKRRIDFDTTREEILPL